MLGYNIKVLLAKPEPGKGDWHVNPSRKTRSPLYLSLP